MRIISHKVSNFGPHRHVDIESGQCDKVLIQGINGSGKSQLLLSLEVSFGMAMDQDLASYIRRADIGEDPSKIAATIDTVFSHNGGKWKSSRRLTQTTHRVTLTDLNKPEEKPVTGVKEVKAKLQEIFSVSSKALESGVFIRQNEMTRVMMGTDSQRRAFLLKLCGMVHMDNIDSRLSARMTRTKAGLTDYRPAKAEVDVRASDLLSQVKEVNLSLDCVSSSLDADIRDMEAVIHALASLSTLESMEEEARRKEAALRASFAEFVAANPYDDTEHSAAEIRRELIIAKLLPAATQKSNLRQRMVATKAEVEEGKKARDGAAQSLEFARSSWSGSLTPTETVDSLRTKLTNISRRNQVIADATALRQALIDLTARDLENSRLVDKSTKDLAKFKEDLVKQESEESHARIELRDAIAIRDRLVVIRRDFDAMDSFKVGIDALTARKEVLTSRIAQLTNKKSEVDLVLLPLRTEHASNSSTLQLLTDATRLTDCPECPICKSSGYDKAKVAAGIPILLARNHKLATDIIATEREFSSADLEAALAELNGVEATLSIYVQSLTRYADSCAAHDIRGLPTLEEAEKNVERLSETLSGLELSIRTTKGLVSITADDNKRDDETKVAGRLALKEARTRLDALETELGGQAVAEDVSTLKTSLALAEEAHKTIVKAESAHAQSLSLLSHMEKTAAEANKAFVMWMAPTLTSSALEAEAGELKLKLESMGRTKAVLENFRASLVSAVEVLVGVTAKREEAENLIKGVPGDRDIETLNRRLATLRTQAQERDGLRGRIALLNTELTSAKKRQDELEDLVMSNSRRQEAVDIIKHLQRDMGPEGVVGEFLQSVFAKLTRLLRPSLSQLNTNFTVEPDPETPLAWRFYDDKGCGPFSQEKLSGGQRAKLSVAFLCAVQQLICPELGFLVLDEPSTNMHEGAVGDLRQFLTNLKNEKGAFQLWVCDHHEDLKTAFDLKVDTGIKYEPTTDES